MTNVHVHKEVRRELSRLRKTDPDAAAALLDTIHRLKTTTRGGTRLDQPGWRAYLAAPDHAIIASGIGSGDIRVLAAAKLPTMYNADQLRQTAEAVMSTGADAESHEVGVPSSAPRSRIVSLNEADTYRRTNVAKSGQPPG